MLNNKFDRNSSYSKEEIEKFLSSSNKNDVTNALLYLTFNIEDFDWVQDTIVKMIQKSEHEDVCGLSITCIGHLARIHPKINKDKVMPILDLKAKDKRYQGRVEDALGDFDMFLED